MVRIVLAGFILLVVAPASSAWGKEADAGAREWNQALGNASRTSRVDVDPIRAKPVVLWKGGVSEAGRQSAASHTSSLSGSRQVWQALARQAGAVVAEGLEQMCDMLVAFRFCRPSTGYRVGITGGGGGRAVLAADACEQEGLILEPIPPGMARELERRYPVLWDWVGNPADVKLHRIQ